MQLMYNYVATLYVIAQHGRESLDVIMLPKTDVIATYWAIYILIVRALVLVLYIASGVRVHVSICDRILENGSKSHIYI